MLIAIQKLAALTARHIDIQNRRKYLYLLRAVSDHFSCKWAQEKSSYLGFRIEKYEAVGIFKVHKFVPWYGFGISVYQAVDLSCKDTVIRRVKGKRRSSHHSRNSVENKMSRKLATDCWSSSSVAVEVFNDWRTFLSTSHLSKQFHSRVLSTESKAVLMFKEHQWPVFGKCVDALIVDDDLPFSFTKPRC